MHEATLDYTVYQVNKEKDVFEKAAMVIDYIASKHPFYDGNKRTAFVTAETILNEAGFIISVDDDEMVLFMVDVAAYQHDIKSIRKWLKKWSKM